MRYILQIQFFGRGRSKAGGGGGGTSTTSASGGTAQVQQAAPTPAQAPQAPQADTTQQAPAPSQIYQDFAQMTDAEKGRAIFRALQSDVPDHLNSNSDLQKLTYMLDMNDKPQVVDDATLDSMNGTECFRTVNSVYNQQADINFTAPQIAKQTMQGRYTRVSSDYQACYGDGIYFATSRRGSTAYGNTSNNVNKTCVIRAKLNNNAKIISYNQAVAGCRRAVSKRDVFGLALGRCKFESAVSIWALANGYNVIDNGSGYYNVINRVALTVSKTVTAKP